MKKFFTLIAAAMLSVGAFAQHYEWTAAQLPAEKFASKSDAEAAGYKTMWASDEEGKAQANYLAIPAQNLIENDQVVVSLPCAYNYASVGNSKYSGYNTYAYKLIMGMNNSTRDGIDPTVFADGINDNKYVRKAGTTDQDPALEVNDAIVKISVPATGAYGKLTFKTNRGGNLGVLYVVDQTKSQQVLLSASRCPDDNIQTNVAVINVQPGHDYYAFASEKGSVELYAIEYDVLTSDSYEVLASEENSTSLWTAAQLPAEKFASKSDAEAAGYKTMWASDEEGKAQANYLAIPAQNLIETEGVTVSLPCAYNYASVGNSKYSGYNTYAYKLIMGMNNSTRDGIDPTVFADGINDNKYVRKAGNTDQDPALEVNDAIVKISVPATGTYGRVILNTNRGGNLGVLYVVDQTKSQQVVLSASRCPDETIKTHATVFNVQPGHDYYVFASEKGSVELYAIGYCETTSEKYAALGDLTGIQNVTAAAATSQKAVKAIQNGKLVIVKGNNVYNVAGQIVK